MKGQIHEWQAQSMDLDILYMEICAHRWVAVSTNERHHPWMVGKPLDLGILAMDVGYPRTEGHIHPMLNYVRCRLAAFTEFTVPAVGQPQLQMSELTVWVPSNHDLWFLRPAVFTA